MTKHRLPLIAVPLLLIVAAVVFVLLRGGSDDGVVEASGTVEATEADLGFQIPGRIEHIAVDEGDPVVSGDELAWIDRRELMAQRRAAEAQSAAALARLTELQRGFREEEIAQGRSSLRAATQRLRDAERDRERARRLYEGGAVSRQRLDDAETAVTVAQSDYERAQESLRVLETGPRREQIAAQRSLVEQAEAVVAQLDAALDHALIRSPFGGVVTVRHREPGETAPAGSPVLTIMDPNDRWIRIYVREDEVGRLALGGTAAISADAYPDRTYTGRVVFIADEAEFTPRNVQTTEERVKLVYRVKVQIGSDSTFDLKPGLPADVRLNVSSQ